LKQQLGPRHRAPHRFDRSVLRERFLGSMEAIAFKSSAAARNCRVGSKAADSIRSKRIPCC